MKIKNYRLFLLSFVAASFVFLTGFERPDGNNAFSSAEKQASSNEIKNQSNSKESLVKSKQKKTKSKRKGVSAQTAKISAAEKAELQKPLDLSMPFKDSENAGLTIEQNKAAQQETLNIFAFKNKKMPRRLNLDGQMLMSQEPEGDKRKSLDGAGIVINLKQ